MKKISVALVSLLLCLSLIGCSAEKSEQKSTTANQQQTVNCELEIECKAVLSNMDKLKADHKKYVNDGVILSKNSLTLENGATAYDVLVKACEDNNISLNVTDSSYGKYIVGINNVDEKDCGQNSGWGFMVNGKYPSENIDKYVVKPGDKIVYSFMCW